MDRPAIVRKHRRRTWPSDRERRLQSRPARDRETACNHQKGQAETLMFSTYQIRDYGNKIFELFFRRELAADEASAIEPVIEHVGLSGQAYRDYLAGGGPSDYERAQQDAATDQVFGVPMFYFQNEPFCGYDRMGL